MIVFHGSDHIIKHPIFHGGKRTNDYGYGFYTTENSDLAKEWACSKDTDGYANRYDLDLSGLSVLNLNSPDYNILNWLAILTHYRSYWQNGSIAEEAKDYLQKNFFINPEAYDIIIGYRADDSYFSFAQDFVAGTISLKKLTEAMRLGKLGEQIVLKNEKAFSQIDFLDVEIAEASIWYEKKSDRDRDARREYRNYKASTDGMSEIYMLDIMREGMKNGDSRLR
ncbi:MAG: DUF3990 domain-containing protein [Oribacterium sp.]|nr:DUF3990 domain-containing protein [Oribacterium sp.]